MPEPNGRISSSGVLRGVMSIGGAGSDNYEDLNHLPQVNGVELKGNKTTEELGINIPTKTSDLNNDSGYVNSSIVANPYDSTSTYVVGAYVTHENNLYKCNTAITTAEEWNAEHWTLVDVISAIPTKTSELDNDSNFASIDDTVTANDKAWSSGKIGTELSNKVTKLKSSTYNLFDGTFYPIDGYLMGTSINPVANYKMTNPMYLEAGNYYYNLITISYGATANVFSKTNESGTTFTKMLATLTPNTLTVSGKTYDIYAFTISESGYYMFNANTGNSETASSHFFMITEQSKGVPTEYVPYQMIKKFENGVYLSEDMLSEIRSLANINPLTKKSISADGDSICYGVGYTGGYAKIIADNNSMNYENLAVGGATIVAETYSGVTPRHWVCRSMQNISTSADYILIEGGVNDASLGVTLGSLSSGFIATLDDTTFYGAIETIFKTLTTKYVGKKYGFIIPHRMTSGMYPTGNYNIAIKECGEKWGVPVLDLSLSIPPFNNFRNDATYDTIREAYTDSGDGWHPTEKCYREYYAPQIETFIKSL